LKHILPAAAWYSTIDGELFSRAPREKTVLKQESSAGMAIEL
jgi:hypothetical protein